MVITSASVKQTYSILTFTGLQIMKDSSGGTPGREDNKLALALLIDLRGCHPLSYITCTLVCIVEILGVVGQTWLPTWWLLCNAYC